MSAPPARGDVGRTRLAGPLGASLLLHAALLALLFGVARPGHVPPSPPMYRVEIVAAPPGPRAPGVVRPNPAPAPPPPAAPPPPPRAATRERAMPLPEELAPKRRPPPPATPTPAPTAPATPPATPAATAGGGPEGGRGTDVATVRTEGIDFPFPGYLENIVRQIALRFHPPRNAGVRAEVGFIIRRDGTLLPGSTHFITRSGNFAFDLEAQGAIEQAGKSSAFGPLPSGFSDDALPVIFSFDPRFIH